MNKKLYIRLLEARVAELEAELEQMADMVVNDLPDMSMGLAPSEAGAGNDEYDHLRESADTALLDKERRSGVERRQGPGADLPNVHERREKFRRKGDREAFNKAEDERIEAMVDEKYPDLPPRMSGPELLLDAARRRSNM